MTMQERNNRLHVDNMADQLKEGGYTKEEVESAKKAWAVTQSLIPKDFDKIAQSATCYFCINEPKGEKYRYANVILAHAEPENFKKSMFGMGKSVRTQIGSLVPAFVPICKRCRGVMRNTQMIKWLMLAAFIAISLLVMAIIGNVSAITESFQLLSYGVIIISAFIGYIVGKGMSMAYARVQAKHVHISLFDVDVIKEMKETGWFLMQDDGTSSGMLFERQQKGFGRVFAKDEEKTR